MADNDADKWARALALVEEEDQVRAQIEDHRHVQALDSRFAHCGRRRVYEMFRDMVNEKGETLSQFEFEALCERWLAVFDDWPPLNYQPASDTGDPDPLPPDDAMLSMNDVVRITGLSESTIKRRVSEASSDFPQPLKLSPRRIGWPAHQIKAWLKRQEAMTKAWRQRHRSGPLI